VTTAFHQLSERQQDLLSAWLPGCELVRDHSWGLVGTIVLEVLWAGERFVVKAGDSRDHHLAREIRAHERWLKVWTDVGRAPEAVRTDGEAKLLVTRYLPGVLVQDTPWEFEPDIYRQAGELLAVFHGQMGTPNDDFEARAKAKAFWWLDRPHRIDPKSVSRLRELVASWPTPSSIVVPTHGDWQPRNWLVHDGVVSVIDFGRTDVRPALTDFARLVVQQWRGRPELEAAFFEGYGQRPGDAAAWERDRVREAIATAVWAHQVRDEDFERQGLRMIEDVLGYL
jgi:aminoglycoside phosphotransferase (APT) family kinase protein